MKRIVSEGNNRHTTLDTTFSEKTIINVFPKLPKTLRSLSMLLYRLSIVF